MRLGARNDRGDRLYRRFLDGERKRQLHEAMQKLKPEHRDILYLLYFEGMSYAEAGTVMKKTEVQISSLAYRATRQSNLRQYEQAL